MISSTLQSILQYTIVVVTCAGLGSCALTSPFSEQSTTLNKPLKALIVDGQNNHKVWPKSTIMMKQYLEESGYFTVDVYRTKPIWRAGEQSKYLKLVKNDGQYMVSKPKTDHAFAPNFSQYDVVISNFGYNAASWPEEAQAAFETYMRNGGGYVSIHSANNSFPDWPEYNLMTGLGGWGNRNEKHGPYLYYDDSGKAIRDYGKGDAGAHGTKHEFRLTKRNEHPIIEGLPTTWMHSTDECYGKLRGPAVNMLVLATAYCPKAEKGTGQHEPALMTIQYHQGRIFHSTLGHDERAFAGVGFITTFLRGAEWAATGQVTQPVPDDFPTENQSSSRMFALKVVE